MKKHLLFLAMFICLTAWAVRPEAKSQDEPEIRLAMCEFERLEFESARSRLEAVLKRDSGNLYARRIFPAVLDKLAEGKIGKRGHPELLRRAFDAYAESIRILNPKGEERRTVFLRMATLTEQIDETHDFLLKLAEDQNEPAADRSSYLTRLAAFQNACANDITERPDVRREKKVGGKLVYVYVKPADPGQLARLKECIGYGSRLIERALALDPESYLAWSYRASLAVQKARLAEMEGDERARAAANAEMDSARKRFLETEAADRARRNAQQPEKNGTPEPLPEELGKELKHLRIEPTLAELMPGIYVDLIAPIAPELPDTDRPKSGKEPAPEWKEFRSRSGLTAWLPADVAVCGLGTGTSYEATDGQLTILIIETPRSSAESAGEGDTALNVLSHTVVRSIGNLSIDNSWGVYFDAELLRKGTISGAPAAFYKTSAGDCKTRFPGVVAAVLGRSATYAISVRGADEKDPKVARFFGSLKF